jgi:hypothetical protein
MSNVICESFGLLMLCFPVEPSLNGATQAAILEATNFWSANFVPSEEEEQARIESEAAILRGPYVR